jgi:hypothetical protein
MRRLIILIAALLCYTQMIAQVTDRGNFVMGSTLGFATSSSDIAKDDGSGVDKSEGPSTRQIHFAPSIGYFLIDNLAAGIRMDYTLNRQDAPTREKTKDSDLLFGPFGRYYFPVGDDIAFMIEAGFGFGTSSDFTNVGGERQSINTNIFAFGIGPGITIVSSEAIGLEALFKYNFARSNFDTELQGITSETTTTTNAFDISLGIQFYLAGFQRVQIDR